MDVGTIVGIVSALGSLSSLAWIFKIQQERKLAQVSIDSKEADIDSKEIANIRTRRQLELDISKNVIDQLNQRISKQDSEILDLRQQLQKCIQDCADCLKRISEK